MKTYEAVIGLEVHAQLLTRSKVFCRSGQVFAAIPNTHVGTTSAGLPGSLPTFNHEALLLSIRAGLALGSKIASRSIFSRKNYFYPDLPKGYQISQYDEPICVGGFVEFVLEGQSQFTRIQLDHIHIEEDAGKLIHENSNTLIDLNRAGTGLIEIVSKPEIKSPKMAAAYLRTLHEILVAAEITDGNLEKGNFRCDANVSIRPTGSSILGTRSESKNVNSFKFVEKAIEFEIARQIAVIDSGGTLVQETRGWDAAANKTFSQRIKEDAQDYRYFPDPDLPAVLISRELIDAERVRMPELPNQKRIRWRENFGLSQSEIETFISNPDWAKYFEELIDLGLPPKISAGWVSSQLAAESKRLNFDSLYDLGISPKNLAPLIKAVENNTLSQKMAKEIFFESIESRKSPEELLLTKNISQLSDESQIEGWINESIQNHLSQFSELKNGKQKLIGFFVGDVMKKSKGRANPEIVNKILEKKIHEK